MKRNNRKGFTLAELLIVVAIIAVISAIAVPLFVGGVRKAQEATYSANVQAVRSAAAAKLLSDDTDLGELFTGGEDVHVYALADVDEQGNINKLNIVITEGAENRKGVTKSYDDWKNGSDANNPGQIVVELALNDIGGTIEKV